MRIIDTVKGKMALFVLASRSGRTLEEVEAEIQALIDETWANPQGREERQKAFPHGKPSPAQFIGAVARLVDAETQFQN